MNKRTAKRIRQNNHRLYHESVKCEIKFKEAVKALLHESGRFEKIIGLTDLTGKDRIVAATVIAVE